jgi:4'-phosphopantetheinyl transferase EntD
MNENLSRRAAEALAEMVPRDVGSAVVTITVDESVCEWEAPLIARAVSARRREFAAGRRCARVALMAVGGPPAAILRGPFGEPVWPARFAGSITHGAMLAGAVAHRSADGLPRWTIDLVDAGDIPTCLRLATSILVAAELRSLGDSRHDGLEIVRRFSAKEAAVKLLSPRLQRGIALTELTTLPAGPDLFVRSSARVEIYARQRWVDGRLLTVACPA